MSGTQVMLYRSTDTGAPTLSGTNGSLIALLDACLKDGYNAKSVQSITRVGTTATVTFATNHNYAADGFTTVQISGATEAAYNGNWKISNITATSFDITGVTGSPATPATGTISANVAPLGWEKSFSGTNKAAYRSSELTATRLYLQVIDDGSLSCGARGASARGFETMSSVDTGAGLFPTTAQLANGIIIAKSQNLDSGPRNWVLAGDGYEFILFYAHHNSYANIYGVFHFGDPASEMASDPYGALIYGAFSVDHAYSDPTSYTHSIIAKDALSYSQGHFIARPYSQLGTSVQFGKESGIPSLSQVYFGRSNMASISPHNNGIYESPVLAIEISSYLPRARIGCIYNPCNNKPLGNGGFVTGLSNLPGRTLYAVSTPYSGIDPGEVHIDITGPWR